MLNEQEKQAVALWQLVSFAVVSLLGTLLHFVYEWSGSRLAALISGVNESTWEHMKLLFFPMLLFAIVQGCFLSKQLPAFWCIKLRGTLLGLALIPTLFYTLRGILGSTPDIVNIAIFFVASGIAALFEAHLFYRSNRPCNKRLAIAAFLIIALLFFLFTFYPPRIPLFRDPISGTYGI